MNNYKNKVSVIGTGAMGSALVEVLSASGASVTVWNRTKEKAKALSVSGVYLAESVAEALRSSPLTIIAVSDQELSCSLVKHADTNLRGRVVASTSFVTPDQANDFNATLQEKEGKYLDLAIAAYPSEVRSGAGIFLISGDPIAYETHRKWFELIGRTTTYVNNTPGSAYISEMAALLGYLPMAVGLLQGLLICEKHNISRVWFQKTVLELYPFHIESLLKRVIEEPNKQSKTEASINVWKTAAAEYITYLQELDIDSGMYEALHNLFSAAAEAGHGVKDWTGIMKYAARHRH